MSGRIGLALSVYLGVIFFQILIVELLPRTNSFTTTHLFMFLSSVFNAIIVLEHVLVYALNALVGKRAELVLRTKKLKRNVRAVRYAVRLQRSFRNHRIHVLHQKALQGLSEGSSKAGASFPAAASTASSVDGSDDRPIAVQVDPAGVIVRGDEARISSRSSTPSGVVDVGIARRPLRGQGHVNDVVSSDQHTATAADSADSADSAQQYLQQLGLRMQMAENSFSRSCRQQKRAVVRKLHDFAAVFLTDANRFFTITTMASYFIGVFYLVRALAGVGYS